ITLSSVDRFDCDKCGPEGQSCSGKLSTLMSLQPISDIETDVLVVGAGGSGLAAAVSAREVGAKVVVIEKNADIGGTTRLSIGSFTSTGTPHQRRLGIADSPDEHLEDMALFAGQKLKYDNAELRRVLADN